MGRPHIVILGAGYGGLMTAIKLQKSLSINDAVITLINQNDYHYQTTWLHENAAGTLKTQHSVIPIRDVVNLSKINLIIDDVLLIKESENKVSLRTQEVTYDYLVIGLGFEAGMVDTEKQGEHLLYLKDLNSARVIREHLEYNFAKYTNDEKKKQGRLNIAIIGCGFTGIEFAGHLVNRIPELSKEYDFEKTQVRIIMLESETVLKGMDPALINYVMNYLVAHGVEIIENAKLVDCTEDTLIYEKAGETRKLPTKTKVWAGGIRANSVIEKSGIQTIDGRVPVRPDLRLPHNDSIYVIGDCARVQGKNSDVVYPNSARNAIEQGILVARNLKAQLNGKKLAHFKASLSPTVASLGHYDGVAVMLSGKKLYGWRAVFLKNLIENRYLLQIGGWNLLMKKGRLHLFH